MSVVYMSKEMYSTLVSFGYIFYDENGAVYYEEDLVVILDWL